MLNPLPPPDDIELGQVMVGICPACRTSVRAFRSQCQHRGEPGMEQYLCVECPKVLETIKISGLYEPVVRKCGTRVRMVPAKTGGRS